MPFTIANRGNAQTERVLLDSIRASRSEMQLVHDESGADVLVFAAGDSAALAAASDARCRMPDAQIVLLAPKPQADRLRGHISFVPHLASAWVADTSAAPEALAKVLGEAASAAVRHREMHALRDKINRQLKPDVAAAGGIAEHQRQRQLELSERYLATVLAQAPQAVISITPEGEITTWNGAAEKLCGIPSRQALGHRVSEVLPGQAAAELLELVRRTLEHNLVSTRDMHLEFAPGSIWAQINAAPVHEGARVLSVSITIEDVSERHHVTALLRASESRYRTLIETLPQLIWTARPDGAADYFSRQWLEYTGIDESEQFGQRWLERVVHPDDRERTRAHWAGAIEGRHPYDIEYRIRRADGRYRWFKLRGTPIHDERGAITEWFGTATDIEDIVVAREALQQNAAQLAATVEKEMQRRAAAEDALHRAQKMEAIGNLTGGIAHDFNNILQVIGGNLHLLSRRLSEDAVAQRRISNALEGVNRGAKLASQLLAFGRRLPLAPKVVNIGRLVREMGDMLRRSLGEGIELETLVAGGLWNTLVDRSNIESALLNLAINARDAMNGEGRLTIEVGNAFLDEEYAETNEEVKAGQYVMLAVTDTGCGMTPEVKDKVFEPFFTTKAEGKGTGLGLSMVYGFVKQSSGHIKIYSEYGHGTTFKLYLPRSDQSEDLLVSDASRPVRGGSETVLVVEDDDAVRTVAVAILRDLGYTVLRARDAKAALSIIESGLEIDLLFTDVVMPGPLKSAELARKARERLPNLAVLYTSGYTQNSIIHHGRLDEGVELLSKPYGREALARKIRHVLANRAQVAKNDGAPQTTPPAPDPGVSLTVLFCEDEVMIREPLGQLLQAKGLKVLLASSGTEALELAGTNDFDVLVTDLGLPGMSGADLVRRIRALHPQCPVVFASGRNADVPGGFPDARVLPKPFNADALHAAIVAAVRKD